HRRSLPPCGGGLGWGVDGTHPSWLAEVADGRVQRRREATTHGIAARDRQPLAPSPLSAKATPWLSLPDRARVFRVPPVVEDRCRFSGTLPTMARAVAGDGSFVQGAKRDRQGTVGEGAHLVAERLSVLQLSQLPGRAAVARETA